MLFLLFFTIFLAFLIHLEFVRRKLPKGPHPLPLIGNIHQLIYYLWKNGGIVEGFNEIAKIHGKVFTIWLGPMPTVYIADYDIAYETHVSQAHSFSFRSSSGMFNYIREGRGIIASNGEHWQEHRRFSLHTFRNFGVGRNLMEDKIMNELDSIVQDFEKSQNSKEIVVDNTFFDLLVGNVINQLLVSKRFTKDDKTFEILKTNLAFGTENMGLLELFLPVSIQKSKLLLWRQKKLFATIEQIHDYCVDEVRKRLADPSPSDEHNDYLDVYLDKIEKNKLDSNNNSSFDIDNLAIDMMDLWVTGQETTSTTLTWAAICLMNKPEVQEKARKELVEVTGGTRILSLGDKKNTPYLNAVINEVQRISSILNINLMRKTTEDTFIDGQPIRAGTAFTTQLSMIHTDENLFENHKQFIPERFLKNDQLEKILIPFGIGKRACLGESLARAELYLFLGNILLRYDMKCVDEKIPKIETISPFAVLRRPPKYNFKFVPVIV